MFQINSWWIMQQNFYQEIVYNMNKVNFKPQDSLS